MSQNGDQKWRNEKEKLEARISELEWIAQSQSQKLHEYEATLANLSSKLASLLEQVHSDVRALQALQEALVPKDLPQFPGVELSSRFLPGSKFGGDYYDAFPHSEKRKLTLFLSSANQFSLSATILAQLLNLQPRWDQLNHWSEVKKNFFAFIESIIHQLHPNHEWHFLWTHLDLMSYQLKGFYRGFTKLFFSPKWGGLQELTAPNPPLKFEQNRSTEKILSSLDFQLQPGSTLIFFSWGFHWLAEEFWEQWVENFQMTETIHELRNQVFFLAQKFYSGVRFERDLTLLILRLPEGLVRLSIDSSD